jgi:ammonium transporter, Amt family
MKVKRKYLSWKHSIWLVAILLAMTASPANAQEAAEAPVKYLPQEIGDWMWLLLTGFLVFFMQAGFAMVETGLTRAKNATNIMMKNLMDFCIGSVCFWAVGYALMYGGSGNGFIGWDKDLFLLGKYTQGDGAGSASWLFQVVFAATSATIVSGGMAERTKFIAYCFYSGIISLAIYPTTGHWIWGGGWLSAMNMRDFAGSTVVHSVGAWCTLAGCIMLGPRIGKYTKDGKVNVIPGHNMPLAALGVFILWFGWYGFNPGSTLVAMSGIGHIAVTTTLGGAMGANAAMIYTWLRFGKPDLSMTLNGTLAGLVAITAPCASVSTGSAVIIGAVAGVLVVESCLFFEQKLKIDDPVGALSVHGINGVWGTLSIGLFGEKAIDIKYWSDATCIKDGLFMGGGFHQLGVQALGVISVFAFVFTCAMILFFILKHTTGLRVSEEEEVAGLDLSEHGSEAYPDFMPVSGHK